ncbi:MFS transporter [Streptomyces sp. NPDC002896]|uniref:MFS transporter n=1 Tax=Streptomyces sp. NPDC002896 TaxID=3154438 RepID=UPI0033215078
MSVTEATPDDVVPEESRTRVRAVVGLLVFVELTSGFIQGGTTPLIPAMRDALGVSTGDAQWITAVQFLAAAVSVPVFGRLGDRYGHRRMLRVAVLCITVGCVVVALAPNLGLLLLGRVLLGPLAALLPLEIGLCRDRLSTADNRKAVGMLVASLALGSMIGSFLSSPLHHLLGDVRFTLWAFAVLAALCAAVAYLGVPESRERASGRMDWAGAGMLSVSLVLFLTAISRGSDWGWLQPGTLGTILVALALFAGWVRWELRHPAPLVDVRAVAGRRVAPHLLTTFMLGVIMLAAPVVSITYLEAAPDEDGYGFGLSALEIGIWGGIPHILAFLAASRSGALAERIGMRRLLLIGLVLLTAGQAGLIAAHSSLYLFALAYSVAGAGMGLAISGLPTVIVEASPTDRSASAVAVYSNVKTIGGTIAGGLFATLLGTLVTSGTDIPTLSAYLLVWGLCTAGAAAALLVTLITRPRE